MTIDEHLEAAFRALHEERYDAAVAQFTIARELYPDHPAPHMGLAETLIASNRFTDARAILAAITPIFTENPWPEVLLGILSLHAGHLVEAREHALRAVRLGADEAAVHCKAITIAHESRDKPLGEQLLESARARFPEDPSLMRFAAERAGENENSQQAYTLWKTLLAREPHSVEALRGYTAALEKATPRERDVVIVYGNCQAAYLCLLLRHIPALAERFEFVGVTNHGLGRKPIPPIPERAKRAVLVIEQYDHLARGDVREAMYASLPGGYQVVRFPIFSLTAFWPFGCQDRRPRELPKERYPWGDRMALQVAGMNLPRGDMFGRYMQLSETQMPDLDRLLAWDRVLMERRDDACDVKMTDIIWKNMRGRRLFWTWGHASGLLMYELILRLIEHSREIFGDFETQKTLQVSTACAMAPGQTDAQVPIHPFVLERLGITSIDANSTYLWFGHQWTFEEYITHYIALDPEW